MELDKNSQLRHVPVQAGAPLRLPKEFERLYDLAYNLWWSWVPQGRELWSQIDSRRWSDARNPLTLLQAIDRETWEALAANPLFTDLYNIVVRRFDRYLAGEDTWYEREHGGALAGPVAYLCAEFGVDHTLPFYSGGLGMLAGDQAKAASDLGLPFLALGLFYRRGYFRQAVDPDGHQQHRYRRIEVTRRPLREVLDRNGHPLRVALELPGRSVWVGAWRIDVGRVPLLLLDTDVPENDPADRPITHILYVRGRGMRLVQEIVLGIGGIRILDALGIEPAVWHINEGHASFSLLERLSRGISAGSTIEDASATVRRNTLFTLHTPVPAGNETFERGAVERLLNGLVPGISSSTLADLGRTRDHDDGRFDLGAVAIRLSAMTSAVSRRHSEVVNEQWAHLLDGPAPAVTNGVHPQTWVGRSMNRVYESVLAHDWPQRLNELERWSVVEGLPNEEVWEAHLSQKDNMLRQVRRRLLEQFARHGASPDALRAVDDLLPDERLTIVFARRFATYKRAGLIFENPGRIREILTDPDRPVQIIFSGKAHPADREGQGLIRWVVEMAKSSELRGHIFFLEDYDMELAGWLAGGADVWLNTPRPPREASGTSGMKAAANGALNLSVLDGWWGEGCDGKNGWGFGRDSHSDVEDAGVLYHILETEVVPLFYDRDQAGIPQAWVDMMKRAMATITAPFSAQRMVTEYATRAYFPWGAPPERPA